MFVVVEVVVVVVVVLIAVLIKGHGSGPAKSNAAARPVAAANGGLERSAAHEHENSAS